MEYQATGVMRYIIEASNSDGSKTRTRRTNGMNDIPRWVNDKESWPNLSIMTPGRKIKYRRVNGIVEIDNTKVNLSTKR